MNNLLNWAEYYKNLRIWVCPYDIEEPSLSFIKKIKNDKDYQELSKTWNWIQTEGVKLIIGKKGIRVLEVNNKQMLKKALKILQLPEEYPWIIYKQTGYGIIIDTPGISAITKGMTNKSYKNILMLWEGFYVLPSTNMPIVRSFPATTT